MKTTDITEHLASKGIKFDQRLNRKYALSQRLIRCIYEDTPLIAIGGEHKKEFLMNAILDGIHWHLVNFGATGKLRIVLGSGTNLDKIKAAIATLVNCYHGQIDLRIEADFEPLALTVPEFSHIDRGWLSYFRQRAADKPPRLADELDKRLKVESFRWYRNLTGGYWSGRVEGLEVCRVGPNANVGQLKVGRIGKNGDIGKARKLFLDIASGREGAFGIARAGEVAAVIEEVAASRANGELRSVQKEHHLESRILRGSVIIDVGHVLEPVMTDYPFQFPTLWTADGSARFLDILMSHDDTPYAVELKVPSVEGGGGGEAYRHAISQAVLYREYVRRATPFHAWFQRLGLDATKCEAIVAFPKVIAKRKEILGHHQTLAAGFETTMVEVDA